MTDRRRINGPPGGTSAPLFASALQKSSKLERPQRSRGPNEHRKIFLRTGLAPSASGSSYLELQNPKQNETSIIPSRSSLKLTCTVHGPRPLPRSAPFSPSLVLSTHVKYAPFAGRQRRGYVRDAGERDLGVHLETALRGVIIGDRWPKSGVDVVITVLEGEEDGWWADTSSVSGGTSGNWGMMTTLSGCITAASAALVEAGIDCVDLITGGVAALVKSRNTATSSLPLELVLDPCPSEHEVVAACVVGYLASRDELTEIWSSGEVGTSIEDLIDKAVEGAVMAKSVLSSVIKASVKQQLELSSSEKNKAASQQVKSARSGEPDAEVQMSG